MKDREFITLYRALGLNKGDSVILEIIDQEKPTVCTIEESLYDKETKVAFLKTQKGNVFLASSILSIEPNRALKAKIGNTEQ